jgi:hypothetical protein
MISFKPISPLQHKLNNFVNRLTGKLKEGAYFDVVKREVVYPFDPSNNIVNTLGIMASGRFDELIGMKLAHEIAHAYQVAPENAGSQKIKEVLLLIETHGFHIITELGLRDRTAENLRKLILSEGKTLDEVPFKIDDIDIRKFDEDGYPPAQEYVVKRVEQYMAKLGVGSEDETIRRVFDLLTLLRELGMSHIDIGHLIRGHIATLKGTEYSFLQDEINRRANENSLTDADLKIKLDHAEKKRKGRGQKIREITLDELNKVLI